MTYGQSSVEEGEAHPAPLGFFFHWPALEYSGFIEPERGTSGTDAGGGVLGVAAGAVSRGAGAWDATRSLGEEARGVRCGGAV